MKNIWSNIWCLNLAILVVAFALLIKHSLDRDTPKVSSEEISTAPITMVEEKKKTHASSEVTRRLRDAGLDGGFATVESSLEK